MRMRSWVSWGIRLLAVTLLPAGPASAQFTGNIQGTVADQSGAVVAQAKVDLVNTVTQVSASTTTDASGSYRFLSLAPGVLQNQRRGQGLREVGNQFHPRDE